MTPVAPIADPTTSSVVSVSSAPVAQAVTPSSSAAAAPTTSVAPAEFAAQYSPQVYAVFANGEYGVSNTILTAPPGYAQPPIGGTGPGEIPTLPPTFFAPAPSGPNQIIQNLQRFASRALVNVAPARHKAA